MRPFAREMQVAASDDSLTVEQAKTLLKEAARIIDIIDDQNSRLATVLTEESIIRRAAFTADSGLHGCWLKNCTENSWKTIQAQRDKIEGLKQQTRNMKKGYERKIARLMKGEPYDRR